jgi:anthranilate synthase/aminodeoxychorismate synthase-like glutamine amidotransferase
MILMIDNYDSFTYNLVQYMEELGASVSVFRNDRIDTKGITRLAPEALVLSPGPGRPETAGITLDAVRAFSGRIPILGVCLGHQAIAVASGGSVVPARKLMHGKTSQVTADGRKIYSGIRGTFNAMRYHSLAVSREDLPGCLEITAEADDGEIMGIRHRKDPTEGIQFHPESIMTSKGKRIIRNFLKGL